MQTETTRLTRADKRLAKAILRLVGKLDCLDDLAVPAPAPSCDAPHCDCATGEDCKANGAAEPETEAFNPRTASSHDVRYAIKGLQKALGVRQDGYMGPATTQALDRFLSGGWPFDVRPDAVNVLPPGTRVGTSPTPDLAARLDEIQLADTSRWVAVKETLATSPSVSNDKLDGLKAAVDALAERLERGPATGTKDDPVPVRLIFQGPANLATVEWRARVTQGVVNPGTYVRDQDGRIAHVCSMITQGDGVTRLFVDVVDEEG